MKRNIFGINFKMDDQPGYQTRALSLDGLLGPQIKSDFGRELPGPKSKGNFRQKIGSMQVQELMPSLMIRKKGLL